MKLIPHIKPTRSGWTALVMGGAAASALALTLSTVPVWAAGLTEAQARHAQEVAACNKGLSNQSRADCLREAGAAHAEAVRGKLDDGGAASTYTRNAAARCDALKGDDYRACVARMQGQGQVSGSVAGGGIYRELVTRETAPAAAPAPLPMEGKKAPAQ